MSQMFDRVEIDVCTEFLMDRFLSLDQNLLNATYERYLHQQVFIERSLLYKLCYLLWFPILKQIHEIRCIKIRRFRKTDVLTECYFTYQSVHRKMSITFYSFELKPIVIHGSIEN